MPCVRLCACVLCTKFAPIQWNTEITNTAATATGNASGSWSHMGSSFTSSYSSSYIARGQQGLPRGMESSFFGGDRRDPNILASSILIGDVKKGEVESEIRGNNETTTGAEQKSDSAAGLGFEGEEHIARLIERIVSNVRATVNLATVRFEFPSTTSDDDTVILLHFPKLDYTDETPMPRDGQSWSPELFIYKFMFRGFIVQMFKGRTDTSEAAAQSSNDEESPPPSPLLHSLTSSIYSMQSTRYGLNQSAYVQPESTLYGSDFSSNDRDNNGNAAAAAGANDFMDEGHNILFGDTEGNQIQIKIKPSGNEIVDHSNQSSIEIDFNISSLHVVLKPDQMRNMLEILETIKAALSGENLASYRDKRGSGINGEDVDDQDSPEVEQTCGSSQEHDYQFKPMKLDGDDDDSDDYGIFHAQPISDSVFRDMDNDDDSTDNQHMHLAESMMFQPMRSTHSVLPKMEANHKERPVSRSQNKKNSNISTDPNKSNSRTEASNKEDRSRTKRSAGPSHRAHRDQYFSAMAEQHTSSHFDFGDDFIRRVDGHQRNRSSQRHLTVASAADETHLDLLLDESLPSTKLHISIHLKSATCSILYKDCDLRSMWQRFMTDNLNRENGPLIPMSDHLWMNCENVAIRSENDQHSNSLCVDMGTLTALEKLLEPNAMTFQEDNPISLEIYNLLVRTNIPQRQNIERIVEFMSLDILNQEEQMDGDAASSSREHTFSGTSTNPRKSPHMTISSHFHRSSNALDMKLQLQPVQININNGLVERLLQVAVKCLEKQLLPHSSQHSRGQSIPFIEISGPEESGQLPRDGLSHGRGSRVQSSISPSNSQSEVISTYSANIKFIKIVFSFPRKSSQRDQQQRRNLNASKFKFQMRDDQLVFMFQNIRVCLDNASPQNILTDGAAASVLNNRNLRLRQQPPVRKLTWSSEIGSIKFFLERTSQHNGQTDKWKILELDGMSISLFSRNAHDQTSTVEPPLSTARHSFGSISSSYDDSSRDSDESSSSDCRIKDSNKSPRRIYSSDEIREEDDNGDTADMFYMDDALERNIDEQKNLRSARYAIVVRCTRANVDISGKHQFYHILEMVQKELIGELGEIVENALSAQHLHGKEQSLKTNSRISPFSKLKDKVGSSGATTDDKGNKNDPNFAMQIAVSNLQVALRDLFSPAAPNDPLGKLPPMKHSYRIRMQDFNMSYLVHQDGTSKIHVRNEQISLSELLGSGGGLREQPILTSCDKLIQKFRTNKSAMLLNLTIVEKKLGGLSSPISPTLSPNTRNGSGGGGDGGGAMGTRMTMSIARILIQLQLNGLYLRHYVSLKQDSWLNCLIDFLKPPGQPIEKNFPTADAPSCASDDSIQESISSLYIMLQDCAIDYAPVIEKQSPNARVLHSQSRLISSISQVKISAKLVNGAYDTHFKIGLDGMSAMLHNDFPRDTDIFIGDLSRDRRDSLHGSDSRGIRKRKSGGISSVVSEFGFINELKKLGFVSIASLDSAQIDITSTTNSNGNDSSKSPLTLVECTRGTLVIHCCSDSFKILSHTIGHLVNFVDIVELIEKQQKLLREEREAMGHSDDVHIVFKNGTDILSAAMSSHIGGENVDITQEKQRVDTPAAATVETSKPLVFNIHDHGLDSEDDGDVKSIFMSGGINITQDFFNTVDKRSTHVTSIVNHVPEQPSETTTAFRGLGSYICDDHFGDSDTSVGNSTQKGFYPNLPTGSSNSSSSRRDNASDIQVSEDNDEVTIHFMPVHQQKPLLPPIDVTSSSSSQAALRPTAKREITVTPTALDRDDTVEFHQANALKDAMVDYFNAPVTDENDDQLREQLDNEYPRPEIEIIVGRDTSVRCFLYDGQDWPVSTRDTTRVLEGRLQDLFIQFDLFSLSDTNAWRMLCRIMDMEVLDKIRNSPRNKLLSFWNTSDNNIPREEGSQMLELLWESIRPNVSLPDIQEQRVSIDMLPIRLNIHQEALMFLLKFFAVKRSDDTSETTNKNNSDGSQTQEQGGEDEEELADESEDYDASSVTQSIRGDNGNAKTEEAQPPELPVIPIFYQSFEVSDLHFKIDYEPVNVNYSSLRSGDMFEMINFVKLSGAEVFLNRIELNGVDGNEQLANMLTESWLHDIKSPQIFRLLLGVLPIRSLYNVGGGLYDLVMLPVGQYQRDGQVMRGVYRGMHSFLSNVAVETVGLTAQMSESTSNVLTWLTGLFGSRTTQDRREPPPPVQRQDIHTQSMPATTAEGLNQALSSVTHGLSTAAVAVVAIPRHGPSHIPLAVLSPFIGTADAIAKILQGVRNQFDPRQRSEHQSLYK